MANHTDTRNWPELAAGLYDKLTGRDAEISYSFDDFELQPLLPNRLSRLGPGLSCSANGMIWIGGAMQNELCLSGPQ